MATKSLDLIKGLGGTVSQPRIQMPTMQPRQERFSGQLGAAIGGLGANLLTSGIQRLAQTKIEEIQKQKMQEQYGPMLSQMGFKEEEIPGVIQLINLHPNLAKEVISGQMESRPGDYSSMVGGGEDVMPQGLSAGEEGVSEVPPEGLPVGQMESMFPEEISQDSQLLPLEEEEPYEELASSTEEEVLPGEKPKPIDEQEYKNINKALRAPKTEEKKDLRQELFADKLRFNEAIQKQAETLYKKPRKPDLKNIPSATAKILTKNYNDQLKVYKKNIEDHKKALVKDYKDSHKDNEKLLKEIVDEESGAKAEDQILNRYEHLTLYGEESSWAKKALVNALGEGLFKVLPKIDASRILTNDTQEMAKLTNFFLRNLPKIFKGGKTTTEMMREYIKSVPNMMQSKGGRLRVINISRLINEAKHLKYNASKDIIKENYGYTPPNFAGLIDERIEDKLNALDEQIATGITDYLPTSKKPNVKTLKLDGKWVKVDVNTNKRVSE